MTAIEVHEPFEHQEPEPPDQITTIENTTLRVLKSTRDEPEDDVICVDGVLYPLYHPKVGPFETD